MAHRFVRFHNFVAGCDLPDPRSNELACDLSTGLVVAELSGSSAEFASFDCEGCVLIPGFIDLQFNGALGVDFSSAAATHEKIQGVLASLLQYGITAILPTLISSSPSVYSHALSQFEHLWVRKDELIPRMLGLHLEGPCLNPDRKGAHPLENLRCPCEARTDSAAAGTVAPALASIYGPAVAYLDDDTAKNGAVGDHDGKIGGLVRVVTLAPEINGGLDLVRKLSSHGVISSIGHTTATYDQCVEAVEAGATMMTHLFNAMAALSHRGDAGPVGLLGRPHSEDTPFFSLIFDGAHVLAPTAVMAFRSNPDKCILVTDAMPALGLPPGEHTYGDNAVTLFAGKETGPSGGVFPGPHVVVSGTQTLAGAVAPLDLCLRNLCAATGCWKAGADGGITNLEAFKLAVKTVTANPAALLQSRGMPVVPGRPAVSAGRVDRPNESLADFVLLNKQSLRVEKVFVGGRLKWSRE